MVDKVPLNEYEYQEYLHKKRWKCSKSPTGAHYWKGTEPGELKCVYCEKKKTIDFSNVVIASFQIRRRSDVNKGHK